MSGVSDVSGKGRVQIAVDSSVLYCSRFKTMSSFKKTTQLAFGLGQLLLHTPTVLATFTHQCLNPQLSCHNTTAVQDLCCFNAPVCCILFILHTGLKLNYIMSRVVSFYRHSFGTPIHQQDRTTAGLFTDYGTPHRFMMYQLRRANKHSKGPTSAMAPLTPTAIHRVHTPTSRPLFLHSAKPIFSTT